MDIAIAASIDVSRGSQTQGNGGGSETSYDGRKKQLATLMARSTDNTVEVSFRPTSFLDHVGLSFKKGDQLEIMGSKTKLETTDIVLARKS
jgi:2-phospho-L-lactate guanylyltransferase (CobY/MobA/RfbA family)